MISILDGKATWAQIEDAASHASTILMGVAYITADQCRSLLPELRRVAGQDGGHIRLLCGIGNLPAQAPEALQALYDLAQQHPQSVSFGVLGEHPHLFHPKFYFFQNEIQTDILIGSSNLTSSAFSSNIECNVHIQVSSDDKLARHCHQIFADWMAQAIEASNVINNYTQLGEVHKRLAALQLEMERLTQDLGIKLSTAKPMVVPQPAPPSPQQRVSDVLTAGYICHVEVSDSRFSIQIESAVAGRADSGTKKTGNLVITDRRSIRWFLLDAEDAEQLRKLRNDVSFGQRSYSVHSPWGPFVPSQCLEEWLKWVQERSAALEAFEQGVIEKLRGRKDKRIEAFKRDFRVLVPSAPDASLDTLCREVEERFDALVDGQDHNRSVVLPRWQRADQVIYPPLVPSNTSKAIADYANTVGHEIALLNLAEFASNLAHRVWKSASQGFKVTSAHSTMRATLSEVERLNFFGDGQAIKWCESLHYSLDNLPQSAKGMDMHQLREHRDAFYDQIQTLLAEATAQESALESWAHLQPEEILRQFNARLKESS
jgi:HKD family nuclease